MVVKRNDYGMCNNFVSNKNPSSGINSFSTRGLALSHALHKSLQNRPTQIVQPVYKTRNWGELSGGYKTTTIRRQLRLKFDSRTAWNRSQILTVTTALTYASAAIISLLSDCLERYVHVRLKTDGAAHGGQRGRWPSCSKTVPRSSSPPHPVKHTNASQL